MGSILSWEQRAKGQRSQRSQTFCGSSHIYVSDFTISTHSWTKADNFSILDAQKPYFLDHFAPCPQPNSPVSLTHHTHQEGQP